MATEAGEGFRVLAFHREDDTGFILALAGFAESRALLSLGHSAGGRCEVFLEAAPGRAAADEEDRAELATWLRQRGVITAEVGELGQAEAYASPLR